MDYRKMMHLYERGVTKNCLAVTFSCKWETVDRAINRIIERWGSGANIPQELTNEGIRQEILSLGRRHDENYFIPDFSCFTQKEINRQNQVLWEEYCEEAKRRGLKPYQISYFNELLSDYQVKRDISYTQEHIPGLECQVDWCGDHGHYMDLETGELTEVHVLVVVLPYSGYTYAEGFLDETMKAFLAGQQHAFEYFGGVPPYVIPDNCATATDRKTGVLNTTYTAFLDYYGALPKPTRIRAPRDKGCVERHVGIIEHDILPLLEAIPITALREFNRLLKAKVDILNDSALSKRNGCRRSIYENEEKKRLKSLPVRSFHISTEKKATVSRDFHIQYDNAFYSVPVGLIGENVIVKDDGFEIIIYDKKGMQVAKHCKAIHKWQRCTDEKHIPVGHTSNNEYSLDYFLLWANKFGPNMVLLCRKISERFAYPVQSFRTLNSILIAASKSHSISLVEIVAEKCINAGVASTKGFNSMLKAVFETSKQTGREEIDPNDLFCAREKGGQR